MQNEATLLLNVAASAQVDLVILDASGATVLDRNGLTGREHRIDLSGIASGVYLYQARWEDRVYQGRFVRQ